MSPMGVGNERGEFAYAIRVGDMDLAWAMLSKETRGMRLGVWATTNNLDMQIAYRAAYNRSHPSRASLLEDFRGTVLRLWPLEDLTDLGMSPTRYVDDQHAFAFLPFGVTEDANRLVHGRLMPGIVLPMLLEEGEWKVDLPGWRFLDLPDKG